MSIPVFTPSEQVSVVVRKSKNCVHVLKCGSNCSDRNKSTTLSLFSCLQLNVVIDCPVTAYRHTK